jgi:hypothetical protein
VKWTSHVYAVGRRFDAIKESIKTGLGESVNGAEGQALFYQKAATRLGERSIPLRVSDHKAELYMWWACWPLSMVWTLLDDPLKRTWYFVYDNIGGLLQRISNNRFGA